MLEKAPYQKICQNLPEFYQEFIGMVIFRPGTKKGLMTWTIRCDNSDTQIAKDLDIMSTGVVKTFFIKIFCFVKLLNNSKVKQSNIDIVLF